MDDSGTSCDEVINADAKTKQNDEETKNFQEILMKKNLTIKTQNFYISVTFLSITTALLIAVSIYCYLTKYQAKQKQLLPFHSTNNKFKKSSIRII